MSTPSAIETRPTPIQPGDPAPDFSLASLGPNATVSLADYRGRSPLFLALFLGLWCPFCRRHIAQMGATEGKLRAVGVESLGIVASQPENARLYFKYRPTRLPLATDPELSTHRAYGVPKPVPTPTMMEEMAALRINPNGEFPAPVSVREAAETFAKRDGYTPNETDQADLEKQWPQLKAQFLIDRGGIVRWANIECAEGLSGLGKIPSDNEILAAARALPS